MLQMRICRSLLLYRQDRIVRRPIRIDLSIAYHWDCLFIEDEEEKKEKRKKYAYELEIDTRSIVYVIYQSRKNPACHSRICSSVKFVFAFSMRIAFDVRIVLKIDFK
jgi:hypothetical protein